MSIQSMTLDEVRTRGIGALKKELGTVGMVRFLQQFEMGSGDYTTERRRRLSGLDLDKIVSEVKKQRRRGKS